MSPASCRERGDNFFGGQFRFTSESSALNTNPPWDANEDGWYADTLGFLTGPRTSFTINMQAVDEHGRKDGSPANLTFDVGFPPCIQCIEVLPKSSTPSGFDETVPCLEDTLGEHDRGAPLLRGHDDPAGPPLPARAMSILQFVQKAFMLVDRSSGFHLGGFRPTFHRAGRTLRY